MIRLALAMALITSAAWFIYWLTRQFKPEEPTTKQQNTKEHEKQE